MNDTERASLEQKLDYIKQLASRDPEAAAKVLGASLWQDALQIQALMVMQLWHDIHGKVNLDEPTTRSPGGANL